MVDATFSNNSSVLSSNTKALLASVANQMKQNPDCNIMITGYPELSKASQALCQRRLDQIRMYLVETQGITANRISTECIREGGDKNTYDIKSN